MNTRSKAPKPPASYEAALAELEDVVQQLESGQTPLDQLLASHARGAMLLAYCRDKLAAVERQIQVLDDTANATEAAETAHTAVQATPAPVP